MESGQQKYQIRRYWDNALLVRFLVQGNDTQLRSNFRITNEEQLSSVPKLRLIAQQHASRHVSIASMQCHVGLQGGIRSALVNKAPEPCGNFQRGSINRRHLATCAGTEREEGTTAHPQICSCAAGKGEAETRGGGRRTAACSCRGRGWQLPPGILAITDHNQRSLDQFKSKIS